MEHLDVGTEKKKKKSVKQDCGVIELIKNNDISDKKLFNICNNYFDKHIEYLQ